MERRADDRGTIALRRAGFSAASEALFGTI